MSTVLNKVKKYFPNVKTVTDATRNAVIEVTTKDTKDSKVKKHTECALALACKRKFHLDGVIISRKVSYLIKGNKARRFATPESVAREIVSFDRGAGFEPGTYELAKVPKSDLMGLRNRPQYKKDREVKEKRRIHITNNVRVRL